MEQTIRFFLLSVLFIVLLSLNNGLLSQPCNWAVTLTPGTQQCEDTSTNGDIFDTNDCLGAYDGGDDYLFEITVPAGNNGEALKLELTSAATWTGIAISDGCPEQAGEVCLGDATSSSGNESFTSSALTGGDTYYIHISTNPAPQSAAFCLDSEFVIAPTAPANDDCGNAISLTVHPDQNCVTPTSGTLELASDSGESTTCTGTEDDDVWYSFVATGTAHIIDVSNIVGNTTDMAYGIFDGNCGSLNNLGCTDANNGFSINGLTAGDTYYVQVYSWGTSDANTTFDICILSPPPPPGNDECADATSLIVHPDQNCVTPTSGTVYSATDSGEDSCGGTEDDDVWYSFVATGPVHIIEITNISGSTTDMAYGIFEGNCNNPTNLECTDTNGGLTVTGLTAGNTYYVQAYSWSGTAQTTSFDICILTPPPPPPNDDCPDAVALTVYPDNNCISPTAGTVYSATDSGESTTCAGTEDDDVWYSFVATGTTHIIQIDNINGSTTDMAYGVFEGTCGGLNNLACTDTNAGLTVTGLAAGNTYYVQAYSWSSTVQTTSFEICILTPPPPPPNDECDDAISLTVYGETCGSPTFGTVYSATDSGEDSCAGTEDDDVWYSFVATASTHQIQVTDIAGSTTDMAYGIFTTSNCNSFTNITCTDNNGGLTYSNFVPGTTYYVQAYSYSSSAQTTSFEICILTPPPPSDCNVSSDFTQFCPEVPIVYPATTNEADASDTNPGNDYDCLGSSPNPAWYYIEVTGDGTLEIDFSNSANVDIDWIMYGPFPDFPTAQGECESYGDGASGGNINGCSYTTDPSGTLTTTATAGDVFVLLVTNFSNSPTNITLEAGAGHTASTSCAIDPCPYPLGFYRQ